jgi:hypothetical protein
MWKIIFILPLLTGCGPQTSNYLSRLSAATNGQSLQSRPKENGQIQVSAPNSHLVYDASECIGAIVMGECHGSILSNSAYHPTCHGEMLNGQCTGPLF